MFNSRSMHKNCLLWAILIFFCLNLQISYAQQYKEISIEQVKATIKNKVIPALEALESKLPTSGRGIAILKTENFFSRLDGRDLTVDFSFKGPNSRRDIYEMIGDKKGPKLEARVESEKSHIFENYGMVEIQRPKGHDWDQNDFHPSVFMSFRDFPLKKRLQYILEHDYSADSESYVSTELDDKGILNIINGRTAINTTDLDAETQISFDTTKEMIPVLIKSTLKRSENTIITTVRLQWTQYDSTWYVSSFEYNIEPDNRNYKFTIKDFYPNVNIWDKEFTVAGLDLHNGMIIQNTITHKKYRYQEEKIQEQQFDEGIDANSSPEGVFYLRSCKTGCLLGPVSLKPGSPFPVLKSESYIIAEPTENELSIRQTLLNTVGYPAVFLNEDINIVIRIFNGMSKKRLGNKVPPVKVELGENSNTLYITTEFIKEPLYETLCNIAAIAQLRIFIEQDAIILSNKQHIVTTEGLTLGEFDKKIKSEPDKLGAFLDAQMLADGWEASYCHIDSFKVSGTRILMDEKGQNPLNRQQIPYYHHERIQDGMKFLVRVAATPQGFDDGADYRANSFDGSIGKEYVNDPDSPLRSTGSIYRGLNNRSIEKDNILAYFLQTMPNLFPDPPSGEDEPWKVKLSQQYPLGIPFFLEKYNKALAVGEVNVRPHLETVAGEACHVLELDIRSRVETFWLAHEKGMLPMKTMYVLSPDRVTRKIITKEVKEITSVSTETGILWYPRVIMENSESGTDYSYVIKVIIDEYVPHYKALPETFSYVFPIGTRVWDRIRNISYIVQSPEPKSLLGKTLPTLSDLSTELAPANIKDKSLLVCFFDINQRPSRNCLKELAERAGELKEKDISVVAVQASDIEKQKLDEWVKENNIPFPVGAITADIEKTLFTWGVRSLPWLILTDKECIIRAEGFNINELDEKITTLTENHNDEKPSPSRYTASG